MCTQKCQLHQESPGVERKEKNTHAGVEHFLFFFFFKTKPRKIENSTANPRQKKPQTHHLTLTIIISIHCSLLSLNDSISSGLKMNRKLKFQRSAVKINQWRQINDH